VAARAVLFDLDGTLLDTLEDLADATNAALARMGLPTHDLDLFRHLVGDGAERLTRRALPEDRQDPETVTSCFDAVREEYARCWDRKTRPYPGVPELLDVLAERRILTAILSNKDDDFTRLTAERLLSGHGFALVQGALPDVPLKPFPDAALDIARRLGVPPGEFLYLGDTGTDMQTARAAGMYAVGALWGFRDREELLGAGAQALIAHPSELLALL
jgi:phosphoglycolate phosphatase